MRLLFSTLDNKLFTSRCENNTFVLKCENGDALALGVKRININKYRLICVNLCSNPIRIKFVNSNNDIIASIEPGISTYGDEYVDLTELPVSMNIYCPLTTEPLNIVKWVRVNEIVIENLTLIRCFDDAIFYEPITYTYSSVNYVKVEIPF
jgi:hypothetical protein